MHYKTFFARVTLNFGLYSFVIRSLIILDSENTSYTSYFTNLFPNSTYTVSVVSIRNVSETRMKESKEAVVRVTTGMQIAFFNIL